MIHATDMDRSIAFYRLLGFDLIDTEGEPMGWARMHCEGGALMFLKAEHPEVSHKHGVLFYMYTPDLPAFREHLLANGVSVPQISYPDYSAGGELCFKDPDGYVVIVSHWSDKEHKAWLERLEKRGIKP